MSLLSGICACLALTFWRPEDGVFLDRLVHVPGAGRLVSICSLVIGVSLQSGELMQGSGGWSTRRKVAVAVAGILLTMYVLSWLAVDRSVAGPHLAALIYDRKRASPLPEMFMNGFLGACIFYPCAVLTTLYVSLYRRAERGREQLSALGSIVAWSGGSVLGLTIILQVLQKRLGLSAALLNRVTLGIGLAAIVLIITIPLAHIVWGRLPSWIGARAAGDDEQARDRFLLEAISYVSDRLASAYGHPAILHAVDERCRRDRLAPYRHKVVLEATRLLTLINARVALAPHFDVFVEGLDDEPAADPRVRRAQRDRHITFIEDVYRVAVLADPTTLPAGVTAPREPPGWRREGAALIAQILQAHGFVTRPAADGRR